MKHWISLLTIANASLGDNSLKELRQENAELEKALSNARSLSPRGKGRGKNRQGLPAPPQQLALAATAHTEQSKNKGGKNAGRKQSGGKGNKGGKGKKGKGTTQDPAVPANPSEFRSFDTITAKNENKQHFFKTRGQMICYDVLSGRCANTPCNKVRGCSTSANSTSDNSTSASWPKSNWPKSKLAEVKIGRSRNWPKSKLVGRSRTDGVCSVSSFSLSFSSFNLSFLLIFTFFLFLLISLFILFLFCFVFVPKNLN